MPGKTAIETQSKSCAKPREGDQASSTSAPVSGEGGEGVFSLLPRHTFQIVPDSFFLIVNDEALPTSQKAFSCSLEGPSPALRYSHGCEQS